LSATLDCPDWDLETIVAGGAAGFDGVGLRGLRATSILQLVRSSRQACRLPKRTDPPEGQLPPVCWRLLGVLPSTLPCERTARARGFRRIDPL